MRLLVDGRALPPPEPLERALEAIEQLGPEDELLVQVNCHPAPLLQWCRRQALSWTETMQPDGTHEILIRRSAGRPA